MTPSIFDLSGQLAVVTGGRRGIGYAMAVALAEAGADIVAVSANAEPSGGALGKQLKSIGRQLRSLQADLSDAEQVEAMVHQLTGDHPSIDILVNNAGTIRRTPAATHSWTDWTDVLQTNLSAPFQLAQGIGQQMISRGRGKIIFTASLLSFQGGINVPGYTAAKSGIAGLTRALANEWASLGINVNAIAPGYVVTDNTQALQDDHERSASILSRIPAGRWGHPSDVGGAAVFLASEAARYIHGVVLPVDGGWLGR